MSLSYSSTERCKYWAVNTRCRDGIRPRIVSRPPVNPDGTAIALPASRTTVTTTPAPRRVPLTRSGNGQHLRAEAPTSDPPQHTTESGAGLNASQVPFARLRPRSPKDRIGHATGLSSNGESRVSSDAAAMPRCGGSNCNSDTSAVLQEIAKRTRPDRSRLPSFLTVEEAFSSANPAEPKLGWVSKPRRWARRR
jgi:hypothetical protein